jgi:O-acetylhomoserine/O-acetylserine sulfhydrylase-like pyridoxal-dependent enzyme
MSDDFIKDIEQALGPVLAKHFYSDNCPKALSISAQHAAKLAVIRFLRSQTDSVVWAAKLAGTSREVIDNGVKALGYREFKSIPKDEWAVDKLFYKKY